MSEKILVAYFSATNTTKAVAEKLAAACGGDLFEIKPAVKYTAADLNWNNAASRSSVEMKNPVSRPAIEDNPLPSPDYTTVFVGFPIWWYQAPTIINTFLEKYNFAGKKIIPFATSGGSDLGLTVSKLQPSSPAADWQQGRLLNKASSDEIADWLISLGLK